MPGAVNPVFTETFLAGAAIAANVFATVDANNRVVLPAAGADCDVVTLEPATVAGQPILCALIQSGGTCRVRAGGVVSVGARVAAAADGEAVAAASTNIDLGKALELGADQTEIVVLLGKRGAATP